MSAEVPTVATVVDVRPAEIELRTHVEAMPLSLAPFARATVVTPALTAGSWSYAQRATRRDGALGGASGFGLEVTATRWFSPSVHAGVSFGASRIERNRVSLMLEGGVGLVSVGLALARAASTGDTRDDLAAQWQLVTRLKFELGVFALSVAPTVSLDRVDERLQSGTGVMLTLDVRVPIVFPDATP